MGAHVNLHSCRQSPCCFGSSLECQPYLSRPEKAPAHGTGPVIHDLVMQDIADRGAFGVSKYGTPLQAHNGRDALIDAYQEALDLAAYLRQAIYERDGK